MTIPHLTLPVEPPVSGFVNNMDEENGSEGDNETRDPDFTNNESNCSELLSTEMQRKQMRRLPMQRKMGSSVLA